MDGAAEASPVAMPTQPRIRPAFSLPLASKAIEATSAASDTTLRVAVVTAVT